MMRGRRTTRPKGHRDRLLPIVADAFAQLGYRRATTAELARRCKVRENVLYRVWPSKNDMFIAAIDYIFSMSLEIWNQLPTKRGRVSAARQLLEYEAVHHGEFKLYRIVFAALGETDDPAIREALQRMYLRFHEFIATRLRDDAPTAHVDAETAAWAFIGIGTISSISREVALMSEKRRQAMFRQIGGMLLKPNKP